MEISLFFSPASLKLILFIDPNANNFSATEGIQNQDVKL